MNRTKEMLAKYEQQLCKEIEQIETKLAEMNKISCQSPSLDIAWRTSAEYTELYTELRTLKTVRFRITAVLEAEKEN